MDSEKIRRLLENVEKGKLSVDEAVAKLRHLPYEDISCAKIDHHRAIRTDVPEVILAGSKKTDDVIAIAKAMMKRSGKFLITRASEEIYRKLRMKKARFHPDSGIISMGGPEELKGCVAVVSAGTSDRPVAEEAELTANFLGSSTEQLHDVGIAGFHRLLDHEQALKRARVIIVVAGMEGALPSLVGGLTNKPLVAVPTSVGYGSSLGGLTALFAMLNSCVPGIGVVNIDNGFGAGCLAHRINMMGLK
ncbi:MAG TPA: nickel pincer cofactor biosynthesis protein LarB [Dissulfurispiraceae bacterium]|nr:nickel pincer cofactor biosynthesis protein LarB [Dissulfurispiraceae bacterium]